MLTVQPFGSSNAKLYTIQNTKGTKLVLTDAGAAVVRLYVPDKTGAFRDVMLGYNDYEGYAANPASHGATIGRCANRIGNASFILNGVTYHLDKNVGAHTLHSGFNGYQKRLWQTQAAEGKGSSITFTLHSPDGDQGIPGAADITATYSLSEDDRVTISYHAISDKDTVFNITNHGYFNLDGHDAGTIERQYLWLDCGAFTPMSEEFITTGEIRPVKGTAMDFTQPKPLGRDMHCNEEQIVTGKGYDHNFVLNNPGQEAPFAKAWSEESGIEMWAFSDLPGVQLYCGNYLDSDHGGKDGVQYPRHGGFCLETQYFPDSPNKPEFPSNIFSAGKPFRNTTVFQFFVKK